MTLSICNVSMQLSRFNFNSFKELAVISLDKSVEYDFTAVKKLEYVESFYINSIFEKT